MRLNNYNQTTSGPKYDVHTKFHGYLICMPFRRYNCYVHTVARLYRMSISWRRQIRATTCSTPNRSSHKAGRYQQTTVVGRRLTPLGYTSTAVARCCQGKRGI